MTSMDNSTAEVTYRWAWWCGTCDAEITDADFAEIIGSFWPGHAHEQITYGLVRVVIETTTREGETWTCVMQGPPPELLAKLGIADDDPEWS